VPGLDVATALARVNGKAELLWRLVGEFRTRHAQAPAQLRTLIEQGRLDAVADLAHTIKGAAATLAAQRISAAAARIESAARHGGDAREPLGELADAFAELTGAVLPTAGQVPALSTPGGSDNDDSRKGAGAPRIRDESWLSETSGAVRRLAADLAGNSFGARGAFDALRAQLAGGDADAELAELGARIDRLDFAAALAKLGDLERRLGLPETP
jgi:HPt (histidine-containing phosphotransfer) domain-containing protein